MTTPLRRYTADHRFLLDAVAETAGLADPVAVDLDEFHQPLLRRATRGPVVPVDGVLIRDWDPDHRKTWSGVRVGARLYRVDGVPFARCYATFHDDLKADGYDFVAVARADYRKLYRSALRARREGEPPGLPPILPDGQLDIIRRNTIGYLDRVNLRRIRDLGGRPKRGLLLSGPPGNGKTSACRWLVQECHRRRLEFRLVTPDSYRSARQSDNPVQEVKELFAVGRRGVVFFDDMDVALRDRTKYGDTDDQAVFLSALDGIEPNEGVAYVFTTNCPLDAIDPAFKRPGRIDVFLHFPPPDTDLRRRLIGRWHPEVLAGIDVETAVGQTRGFSFAEVEELRNLLVMRYTDAGVWDWDGALTQFRVNRDDHAGKNGRLLGFAAEASRNGH